MDAFPVNTTRNTEVESTLDANELQFETFWLRKLKVLCFFRTENHIFGNIRMKYFVRRKVTILQGSMFVFYFP
jgi:hypothetical protein